MPYDVRYSDTAVEQLRKLCAFDDLIDYLIERNPKFMAECREIRDRMRAGKSHSHDDVKQMLAND